MSSKQTFTDPEAPLVAAVSLRQGYGDTMPIWINSAIFMYRQKQLPVKQISETLLVSEETIRGWFTKLSVERQGSGGPFPRSYHYLPDKSVVMQVKAQLQSMVAKGFDSLAAQKIVLLAGQESEHLVHYDQPVFSSDQFIEAFHSALRDRLSTQQQLSHSDLEEISCQALEAVYKAGADSARLLSAAPVSYLLKLEESEGVFTKSKNAARCFSLYCLPGEAVSDLADMELVVGRQQITLRQDSEEECVTLSLSRDSEGAITLHGIETALPTAVASFLFPLS